MAAEGMEQLLILPHNHEPKARSWAGKSHIKNIPQSAEMGNPAFPENIWWLQRDISQKILLHHAGGPGETQQGTNS